jgi:hypothetical protein
VTFFSGQTVSSGSAQSAALKPRGTGIFALIQTLEETMTNQRFEENQPNPERLTNHHTTPSNEEVHWRPPLQHRGEIEGAQCSLASRRTHDEFQGGAGI